MSKAPKRIKARPDSELVVRIKEAISDGVPLVVDVEDESFPLYPEPGRVVVGPKSRRMKDQILAQAGAWRDVDADALIERLYEARRAARPSDPVKL
jgi:hypothetical protein